jgi:uncharacterized protein YdhG (YjbR/CyaY superfamily)
VLRSVAGAYVVSSPSVRKVMAPPSMIGIGGRTLPSDRVRKRRARALNVAGRTDIPEVDAYIARCPVKTRGRLQALRRAIRAVARDATEVISYSMPGYCYAGYSRRGIFAWFALQSGHIGLYVRPPTITDHRQELEGYVTTKSAVHLPLEGDMPTKLIQKLVRASVRVMKETKR